MKRYCFDIETNGVDFNDLQNTLKVIHDIVIQDIETLEVMWYTDREVEGRAGTIDEGVAKLEEADELIGHNILGFDIPAIQVLYPKFTPQADISDTRSWSETIFPHMKDVDFSFTLRKNPDFPKNLIGLHSLESWGHRLGNYKDDFSKRMKALGLDPWGDLPEEYQQERSDYCIQDVKVNVDLYFRLDSKGFSRDSLTLEQEVRRILARQQAYGFLFDEAAAVKLYSELVDIRLKVADELREMIAPFYVRHGKAKIFKKDMRRFIECEHGAHEKIVSRQKRKVKLRGYYEFVGGGDPECPVNEWQPIKMVSFKPGSRDHIANRLQKLYGWKPKAFGNDGKPTVDESVLKGLNYPPVKLLLKYFLVDKRIGMLAEGNEAWLKCVHKDGRIRGRVYPMGAVTSRMTHSKPNVAQTPAGYSPYGKECRSLFIVPKGKKLVGMDADALELRMLAGYMAKWDDGDYIKVVLNGDKSQGTDIHSRNRDAVGLRERDTAKTWFYAFIYGAGDYKLGTIIASEMEKPPKSKKALVQLGRESRENFERNLPALGKLVKRVKKAAKKRKRIRGLDGRFHPARSEHAALNTLLQGAGAIVMKRALVIADQCLQDLGYVPGMHYEFVANVHDELQNECNVDIAETVGKVMADSLELAGAYYQFACPITGSYDIGDNWSQTH